MTREEKLELIDVLEEKDRRRTLKKGNTVNEKDKVQCPFGCGGKMFLIGADHEAEDDGWHFGFQCSACSKEDSVFLKSSLISGTIYKEWKKCYQQSSMPR